MSLVTHKYTPAEMSVEELQATFAARGHTVDYLLKALRDQIHSGTLSSFVITGPRGAGKSTVIRMVALRIRQDAELNAAWLPMVFPEEQFNIVSLRDLLAATLQAIANDGLPLAKTWLDKVQAESNDEQSQQLAITGLRDITRQVDKRLILFVENLNLLLEDCLDDQMKGTLRRLLMADPFMMIVGSAVHNFDSLRRYNEAFFNYFGQVPLDRLSTDQVTELLRKRAEFDGNKRFLDELPKQQAKVRTLVHLTGGNPRFVLMLYELLSLRQVATMVQYLRRLVDELTPLLKDEMENLPPQQRKIIHALMERGGTATPTDLVGPTRLPLNAITTQLKRLKDSQILEVPPGGGKGRAAHYTVPDKLFSIWYQMRYLNQNRRRIELFVEVLRVWFEEEERMTALRNLAAQASASAPLALRECATSAEYVAASLRGTAYAQLATELCIGRWIQADLSEAALAYADLAGDRVADGMMDEASAHAKLAGWLNEHDDPQKALEAVNLALANRPANKLAYAQALCIRGIIKRKQGDFAGAITDYSAVIALDDLPKEQVAWALISRGVAKGQQADLAGAIADFSSVITPDSAPKRQIAYALFNRGFAKRQQGDLVGEIADYNTVITLDDAPKELVTKALFNRGFTKGQRKDVQGAIADYSALIALAGAPKKQIAQALVNRGVAKGQQGDLAGELADYSAVIALDGATKEGIARALVNRGVTKGLQDDIEGAMADFTEVVTLDGAPKEQVAMALFNRGLALLKRGDSGQGLADLQKVIESQVAEDKLVPDATVAAFAHLWSQHKEIEARRILAKLSVALTNQPKNLARETTVRFLNSLATPAMKKAWPLAWRSLAESPKAEVKEALEFLKPVCEVLEGQDRKLLDALPPEQREFAQEVLAKFEAKPPG